MRERFAGGLTLLFGLGLFTGIAYALTRKEEAARPALPPPPPPLTPPPPTPPPPTPPPPTPLAPLPAAPEEPLVLAPPPSPPEITPVPILREADLVRAVVPINIPTLDDNLTIDEIDAVAYALAREQDPHLLLQFATSFFPEHIITASLLMAKAKLLSRPEDARLQAAIEDAVRRKVDLRALAEVLLPEFREASDLLRARDEMLRSAMPMSGGT